MQTWCENIWTGSWPADLPELGIHLKQRVYRAHNPEWAWHPESGAGAALHGGRFNVVGRPALYTSVDVLTAIREASALGRPMQPLTMCEYRVNCHRVLNAQDPQQLKTEGIKPADLACQNWEIEMLGGKQPASQSLAERLVKRGYCAIRVQSFAHGTGADDMNVVFWNWSRKKPTLVRVIDSENRLPGSRASWQG